MAPKYKTYFLRLMAISEEAPGQGWTENVARLEAGDIETLQSYDVVASDWAMLPICIAFEILLYILW